MIEHPPVSVIVPTFRRFEPLLDTLEDLLAQEYPDFEIVVVDQNDQWPAEMIERCQRIQADQRIRWLRMKPGVVAARNEAVRNSRGDILVFVDDDVMIKASSFIHRHVRNYGDASIAAVTGREWKPANLEQYRNSLQTSHGGIAPSPAAFAKWSCARPLAQVLGFGRDEELRYEICTFSTCNGSIRREVFLALGGFDEQFRGNSYGDDYDLALRLNARGHKIIYDPEAGLVHLRTPVGGLRLSDDLNPFNETSKALCCWIFFLRYACWGFIWHLAFHHILRKTVLLKRNVVSPWRQFWVVPSLIFAFFEAIFRVYRGPVSRLAGK